MVATGMTADTGAADGPADAPAIWRPGEIWRDIARGGIAGLAVGVLVGGIGGRLVMRLAAIRVTEATGAFTENGNRIGDITIGGSIAVITFGGLLVAIFAGVIGVVVRPWLPGTGLIRALSAALVAIGFGSFVLIRAGNDDFLVLRNDPVVVGLLVGLVGLVGLAASLLDEWLDGRLPIATSVRSPLASVYAAISLIGLIFLPLVVAAFLGSDMRLVGLGLVVVGLATLRWWALRFRGLSRPPEALLVFARVSLAFTVAVGLAVEAPEIAGALGM
jgi:hypothetical protein